MQVHKVVPALVVAGGLHRPEFTEGHHDGLQLCIPIGVAVVEVYHCSYANQATETPVYTREVLLLFAEDTTL